MENRLYTVICSLNSQYIHSSLAPWCLLASVADYCPEQPCTVVEGTINENPQTVFDRILSHRPNVVGFCCYIWNITAVTALVRMIKGRSPHCVIILGGPEVSYHAKEILQDLPLVDYVIAGEGERPFASLLHALGHGLAVSDIPGVCYRKGSEFVISEPHTPHEMPPSPYSSDYFTALQGRISYLETSRGCPYSCAFCLSGRCGGVRYYDLERAKQELLLLANSGTQTIKLVDRTFNANRSRANALFSFLIEHYGKEIPFGVCFHFEIAGDLLDSETIALLATAPPGSMQFEIGLQSFHPQTLDAIHRKTNVERLKRNITALLANGNAHIHIDLIAGLPYENLETFQESFHTAFALKPHMLQLGFLKLLHGALMREDPLNFPCEFDPLPPYAVNKTPWLSASDLTLLHHTDQALDRLYNRGRFHRTLSYLLEQLEKSPFALFASFGEFLAQTEEPQQSLDDFTTLVFCYFSAQNGVSHTKLRDSMVCDRLATNSSGKLPKVLRIEDHRLKMALKTLDQKHPRKKAIKRGYALLYGEGCLVYVDYHQKHPVTAEYTLQRYPIPLDV